MNASFEAQFPWAPITASVLFVTLTIWAWRVRKKG